MVTKTPGVVAQQINALCLSQQRSQSYAAKQLGMNRMSFHRRMTGEVEFRASELQRVAALFSVPVGYLFGEDSEGCAS